MCVLDIKVLFYKTMVSLTSLKLVKTVFPVLTALARRCRYKMSKKLTQNSQRDLPVPLRPLYNILIKQCIDRILRFWLHLSGHCSICSLNEITYFRYSVYHRPSNEKHLVSASYIDCKPI